MLEIKEIYKLKEDLSNAVNHYIIGALDGFGMMHKIVSKKKYEEFLEAYLTPMEKSLIKNGYAKIKDNVFYCSLPNCFQRYEFKERFNVVLKEVVKEV